MSVIVVGMTLTANVGDGLRATPSRRKIPWHMVLRRVSEAKEPGVRTASLVQANCFAGVADGSHADALAVKPELEQMRAA